MDDKNQGEWNYLQFYIRNPSKYTPLLKNGIAFIGGPRSQILPVIRNITNKTWDPPPPSSKKRNWSQILSGILNITIEIWDPLPP